MPSKKIRLTLYADENFPLSSVNYLRSQGVSIIHAYSKNYIQKSDLFHLRVSKNLKRILITRDRDFKYNWTTLKNHPGVILISPGSQTSDAVNRISQKAFKKLTLNFISESLVRVSIDIGNSRGIRIPKPILSESGLGKQVKLQVKKCEIRIIPVSKKSTSTAITLLLSEKHYPLTGIDPKRIKHGRIYSSHRQCCFSYIPILQLQALYDQINCLQLIQLLLKM